MRLRIRHTFKAAAGCDRVGISGDRAEERRQAGRQKQIVRSDPVVNGVGALAVDVRNLVPVEEQVVLADLGRVEADFLVAIAGVERPNIDAVHAVVRTGRYDCVAERSRSPIEIFIIFREAAAVAGIIAVLRMIDETASAGLDVPGRPPRCFERNDGRGRHVGGVGRGCEAEQDDVCSSR